MQPYDLNARLLSDNLRETRRSIKRISRSNTRKSSMEKLEELDMKLGREDLLLSSSSNNMKELEAINRLKDLSEGEISSNNSFEEKFKDFCLFETIEAGGRKSKNTRKINKQLSSSLSPTASGPKGTLETSRDLQSPTEICTSNPDLADSPKGFGLDEMMRTFTKRLPTIRGVTKEDEVDSPRKETEGLNTIRQTLANNFKRSENHLKSLQERLQDHLSKKAINFSYAAKGGGYTNASVVRILSEISRFENNNHGNKRNRVKSKEIFKPIVHGRSISLPRIGRPQNNKSVQYYQNFDDSQLAINEKRTDQSAEREATRHDDTDVNLSRVISPRQLTEKRTEFSPDASPNNAMKRLEFGAVGASDENKIIYVRQTSSEKREMKLVKGGILAVITQKDQKSSGRQIRKSASVPDKDKDKEEDNKTIKIEGERVKDYKLEWQAPKDFTSNIPKFITKIAMQKLQTQVLGKRALILKTNKEIRQSQSQLSKPELKIESNLTPGQNEPPTAVRILLNTRENAEHQHHPKIEMKQAKSQQLLVDREKRYAKLIKTIDGSQATINVALRHISPDRVKEINPVNTSREFSDLNLIDTSSGIISKNQLELNSKETSPAFQKVQSRITQRFENIARIQGKSQHARVLNNMKLEPLFQQSEYRQVGNLQGYLL